MIVCGAEHRLKNEKLKKEFCMKAVRWLMHVLEYGLLSIGIGMIFLTFVGIVPYIVLSGSMEPSISTGSIVLVDTTEKDYRIGDIISYKIEDQIVTHRIVKMENGVYKTKGDSNEIEDSVSLNISQIIGKVKVSIPKLGYLISHLKSKQIVLLMIAILFLSNLFDILSENRSQKTKKENRRESVQKCTQKRI